MTEQTAGPHGNGTPTVNATAGTIANRLRLSAAKRGKMIGDET